MKLQVFQELLLKYNENINLTAITDPEEIRVKHFLDSITPAKHFKFEGHCIDIGTGAGFPGIPLAIELPNVHFTLLDSTAKKINFLNLAIGELGLDNVSTIIGRAEEIAHTSYRQVFNISTSRAVAHLKITAEYSLPFLKIGGHMLAYKARDVYREIEEAKEIVEKLGGKIVETIEYNVDNYERSLVIIEKIKDTPEKYPRKYNQIK
ncbi:MAG: 16S rRNA (guanine(527)-N(7))-methyltransferase RsmG [Defluviitaleaceae bacterium]|nr:16S rRNA (guanine(527)-N(7))-methyltransferase RsmG [Defluviitaleaceae bacterium]